MTRYVCVHGHFYQPPRDNPWLEAVEAQDSARPFHDWNERIHAECYGPNGASRVLDDDGRVEAISNNYEHISFNFGPTLLSWLEVHAPHTYARIQAADRAAAERFGGHGNALAQAYNHLIMPLANARDRRTQVKWGVADFVHRFQRRPEGMWLPETAACLDSLEALAEHDIAFTILAPNQAHRVRPIHGDGDWHDVSGGHVDPTRPYRVTLPSGKTIAVFFYDGPTARAVAFERLLERGERLAERLAGAFTDTDEPQLVHIATDGETYGHHHRRGDMALAWALRVLEDRDLARLTIYGEYLDVAPPAWEAEIHEQTSWSCAHGVERWRSDCGCSGGHGDDWNQGWRAPLREALDMLRDAAAERFEAVAGELLEDPWAARDAYIDVILDRSSAVQARFFEAQARRHLDAEERVAVLELMELQRHAQLMYTSCGWFFDDVSGLETQQILSYAARVCQLAARRFDADLETPFLEHLERAQSNLPDQGNGRLIYERWVRPSQLDLERVGAHDAIQMLFEPSPHEAPETRRIYCYEVTETEREAARAGETAAAVGRAAVRDMVTGETRSFVHAALRFGGHHVAGGVAPDDDALWETVKHEVLGRFDRAAYAEIVQYLGRAFANHAVTIQSLFRDEQRRVVERVLDDTVHEAETAMAGIFRARAPLMRFIEHLRIPQPRAFVAAAEIVLQREVTAAVQAVPPVPEQVRALLEDARSFGVSLDHDALVYAFREPTRQLADQLRAGPREAENVAALRALAEVAATLPFEIDLAEPQDAWFDVLRAHEADVAAEARAGAVAARDWLRAFAALGEALHIAVPDGLAPDDPDDADDTDG